AVWHDVHSWLRSQEFYSRFLSSQSSVKGVHTLQGTQSCLPAPAIGSTAQRCIIGFSRFGVLGASPILLNAKGDSHSSCISAIPAGLPSFRRSRRLSNACAGLSISR